MIAFSFFEPITAPKPDLAAILPLSLTIPDINDRFSPDCPMLANCPRPCFSFNVSSVWTQSNPHKSEASLICFWPSIIVIHFGLLAIPLINITSNPHFLISGPKYPPQLASPHPPVSGDLPATMKRPEKGAPVPVSNPGKNPMIASGPKGSALAGILS